MDNSNYYSEFPILYQCQEFYTTLKGKNILKQVPQMTNNNNSESCSQIEMLVFGYYFILVTDQITTFLL